MVVVDHLKDFVHIQHQHHLYQDVLHRVDRVVDHRDHLVVVDVVAYVAGVVVVDAYDNETLLDLQHHRVVHKDVLAFVPLYHYHY